MKNILFVCTGNSVRSQMAEGFGKQLSGGKFNIRSAGLFPTGIHPMTVKTMKEVGIDISEQTSDMLTQEMIAWCNYLVTLCGSARDRCAVVPPGVKHFHWEIENPDIMYTSDDDRHREFARVRDNVKKRVERLFRQIEKGEV